MHFYFRFVKFRYQETCRRGKKRHFLPFWTIGTTFDLVLPHWNCTFTEKIEQVWWFYVYLTFGCSFLLFYLRTHKNVKVKDDLYLIWNNPRQFLLKNLGKKVFCKLVFVTSFVLAAILDFTRLTFHWYVIFAALMRLLKSVVKVVNVVNLLVFQENATQVE